MPLNIDESREMDPASRRTFGKLKSKFVSTGSGLPSNPKIGDSYIDKATGSLFYYYGPTTGWKPPWSNTWGVLAKATYAVDQTLLVASGASALSGLALAATVVANRYTTLHTNLTLTAAAAGTFRMQHVWNGGVIYIEEAVTSGSFLTYHFASPPLGLVTATANYTAVVAAITSNALVNNASYGAAHFWVEDLGPNGAAPPS